MTKTARVEIIAALHTRMLQLADYPTPQDYKLVCQKLVSVYPTLGDCNGSGYVSDTYYYYSMYLYNIIIVYVQLNCASIIPSHNIQGSWKEQLKQKFRNGRRGSGHGKRPISTVEADKENQAGAAVRPSKKRRCVTVPEDDLDTDKYTHNVEKLRNEYEKDEPRLKRVRSLMKKTFSGRQQWIQQDCPSVEEVLRTFPCLQHEKTVSLVG